MKFFGRKGLLNDVCDSCSYGIREINSFTCLNGTFLDYERKCFYLKKELEDADKSIMIEINQLMNRQIYGKEIGKYSFERIEKIIKRHKADKSIDERLEFKYRILIEELKRNEEN